MQGLEQAEMLPREENEAGFPHKALASCWRVPAASTARAPVSKLTSLQNPDDEDEIAVLFATIGGARRA